MTKIVKRSARARRFGFTALVTAVLAAGGIGLAPVPASALTAITAHGHVVCAMDGKVKYSPKLQAAAHTTVAGFKAKLTCSAGETGSSQVTVRTGKVKGTSGSFSGSCGSPAVATMTATILWKATGGKVASTTITWNRAVNSTHPYEHSFDTATITGSYSAQDSVADFVGGVSQDGCAVKPLKRWAFLGSSFEILTAGGGGGGACGPIATAADQTTGSNGHVWMVVAPASHPACAPHPTGTLTWSVHTQLCGNPGGGGPIGDSGNHLGNASGSHPANLWGVDTGLTAAQAQQLTSSCIPVAGGGQTYSGDATYSGF